MICKSGRNNSEISCIINYSLHDVCNNAAVLMSVMRRVMRGKWQLRSHRTPPAGSVHFTWSVPFCLAFATWSVCAIHQKHWMAQNKESFWRANSEQINRVLLLLWHLFQFLHPGVKITKVHPGWRIWHDTCESYRDNRLFCVCLLWQLNLSTEPSTSDTMGLLGKSDTKIATSTVE